jgi:outer membrane protein TolC
MTPTFSRQGLLPRALIVACLGAACLPPARAAQDEFPLPVPRPGGPPVYRLTLEEARQLALQNNKALALARLNIAEKGYATDAARKDYFPKAIAFDSYTHFNDDLGKVVTIRTGRFGILPPGSRFVSVAVVNQDTNYAGVLAVQPITKLIAVNAGVQLARADEIIARAKLDCGRLDLLSGVAQVYHGLLGAQRIQAALELQIKLLEQLGGDKPPPELRIGLLEIRQGLLQVRGQVQELTQQLNNLLDLPPCTVLELVDPVPGDLGVACADEAAQRALACSAEVREAEQNIAKAQAALKVAKMDYLPDVNVVGGYANQTGANYIQDNIGYVGVTATYTFWEWGKRRDVKWQRQTTLALAQQNLRVTIDKVQLEARKTYGTFEQAREAYKLAEEMVQARKDAEKGAAGAAAMQAKAETSKAELEAMKAEIAYRVAHAQLLGVICQE